VVSCSACGVIRNDDAAVKSSCAGLNCAGEGAGFSGALVDGSEGDASFLALAPVAHMLLIIDPVVSGGDVGLNCTTDGADFAGTVTVIDSSD
jgi:hypothetical protein